MLHWKSIYHAVYQDEKPSALTIGLPIFSIVFYFAIQYILSEESFEWVVDDYYLHFDSLFKFKLNALSMHALFFSTMFEMIVCLLLITIPLNIYEREHGTVFTGVFLNLITTFSSIFTCLIGKLLSKLGVIDLDQNYIPVAGMSGWLFVLLGFFTVRKKMKNNSRNILIQLHRSSVHIPTVMPSILLLVLYNILQFFIYQKNSSLLSVYHTVCLGIGYLISSKETYFAVLVPPSGLIMAIERVLNKLINLIPLFVQYYKEKDMKRTFLNAEDAEVDELAELPTYQN
ncbi:hypothetical protein TPHA_0D03580 [Tetrapisispora phaffii CBS 4417]|uniref:Peptidase S54 rhomboid domain-containing protein n=1 Tax=Tetrapisispora phaffii (strain ATCC 24235 / CBS 4417 / NBRC 1672 / NRRL Y-8282 / UCD 70-5) TaxID=1071381 RepID=G8BT22_TETPH|nr:hypothetical protein TPHA_0D03580 [Tetrapisispora phaffii CBS 4417]CCE62993.1 hypothetical protein TPHA_0D03580 [Tetrapisispora phaffii CBS 4417]